MARVHRTFWIVRRRYRRIGYLGSLLGASICAVYMVPAVYSAQRAPTDSSISLVVSAAIFAAAVLVPPIVARLLWWMHRGRFFDDMYQITRH